MFWSAVLPEFMSDPTSEATGVVTVSVVEAESMVLANALLEERTEKLSASMAAVRTILFMMFYSSRWEGPVHPAPADWSHK
jgi:hypothetical protein